RRMAGAVRCGAVHVDTGADLVHPQGLFLPVRVHLGARHLPALPLRPADAPGLEGVPAVVAGVAGAHRRRADAVRVAAPCARLTARVSIVAGLIEFRAGSIPRREEKSDRWRSWIALREACCWMSSSPAWRSPCGISSRA